MLRLFSASGARGLRDGRRLQLGEGLGPAGGPRAPGSVAWHGKRVAGGALLGVKNERGCWWPRQTTNELEASDSQVNHLHQIGVFLVFFGKQTVGFPLASPSNQPLLAHMEVPGSKRAINGSVSLGRPGKDPERLSQDSYCKGRMAQSAIVETEVSCLGLVYRRRPGGIPNSPEPSLRHQRTI